MHLNYQFLETQSSLTEMIKQNRELFETHMLLYEDTLLMINHHRKNLKMPIANPPTPETIQDCIAARNSLQQEFNQELAAMHEAANDEDPIVIPAKQSESIEDERVMDEQPVLDETIPQAVQFAQHHPQEQIQQQIQHLSPSHPAMLHISLGDRVPSSNDSTYSIPD